MIEDEVNKLTMELESTNKPRAFDLARRGALLRKVKIHRTENTDIT